MATLKVTNIKNESFAGDQLYLKTDGTLGLGTTSPAFPSGSGLEIYNSSVPRLKLTNSTSGTAAGDGSQIYLSASDLCIDHKETGSIKFYTVGTTKATLDSSGRLLIGTTSADDTSQKLKLYQAGNDHCLLNLNVSSSSYSSLINFGDNDSWGIGQIAYAHSDDSLRIKVNAGERFRIKSDGDIEVGGNLKTNNLPGRNLIINGSMICSQRSTSKAITGAGYHVVDRFQTVANSSMSYAVTMSQETDGPTGFEKCVKLLTTTASTPSGSQNYILRTNLEAGTIRQLGWGTSGSKAAVLSFWVKSNKTGTYTSQIYIKGQSSTVTMIAAYTISSSATWEKKTISIPAYTTSLAMKTTHTDNGCSIDWGLASGPDDVTSAFSWTTGTAAKAVTGQVNLLDTINNYWQVTGIQFEIGSIATEFEHRSYGEELARCQRYYQRWKRGYLAANSVGTSDINIGIPLTVSLRAAPSIAALDMHRSGNKTTTVSIVSVEYSDVNSIVLEVRVGGWTGGNAVVDEVAYVLIPSGDTMELNSEL